MVTIRRYRAEDQGEVEELINSIMSAEFPQDTAAYPSDDLRDIDATYGGIGEAFFVAADKGKVIGTVAIKKEDDRVALLRRLFVATPYRNQQIGLKLIDRALQFCYEVGYQEVVFRTTSRMERAIKLCTRRGFVPRAKLRLGDIELLKFSLSLKDGVKTPAN